MIEKAKSFIRSAFPGSTEIYRRLTSDSVENIFSSIHQNNLWADPESVSGRGSTLLRTGMIRRTLPALLESVSARSLLDAACGDFNWMRHVALEGIKYTGVDVVRELITRNQELYQDANTSFVVLDITRDPLPQTDVILCRDCFIHFSYRHTQAAIANFKRSNSRFLLTTTHRSVRENMDIRTGEGRSVNLELTPFNFAPPIQLIIEDPELGKCLGLWNLGQL